MFLDFTIIEGFPKPHEVEQKIEKEEIDLNYSYPIYPNRKYSFDEQFYNCVCNHIYYNHVLGEGKCDIGKCKCKIFISCEAKLELVFTTADRFEIENPDHAENDSPRWWVEFGEWYDKQK